jgi:hypothetical protein
MRRVALIFSGFGLVYLWVTSPQVRAYVPSWIRWQLGLTVNEVAVISHNPLKLALWIGLSIPVLRLAWMFRDKPASRRRGRKQA